MRGRKPKPTKLKILAGNPGKRPLPANEPQPSGEAPTCPEWLDDIARDKWSVLAPELARLGLLTSVDGDILAAYCQAWAEFRISTETVRKEGRCIQSAIGSTKPHPAAGQQRTAWKAMREFAALFGLDPSSRVRLGDPRPADDGDPMESFLKKGKA